MSTQGFEFNRVTFGLHIAAKDIGHCRCVQHACLLCMPEIEEITPLAALVEGAEFGPEQLGRGIDWNDRGSGEPP